MVHLDVRVLCATHQDLRSLVEEGRFRADLFYRINVLSLYVPPLRERPEDIMELAVTYLEAHLDNPPPDEELRRQLRTPLLRHTWPGNIRELLSIMERLAIVANHMRQVDDWAGLLARIWEVSVQEAGQKEYGGEPVTLREHLAREEARFIDRTIDACGGDLGQAAARLGISRMTLWRKLHSKEGREAEEKV